MMFHGGWESRDFCFPAVCQNFNWRLFIDTAADEPNELFTDGSGPRPNLKVPLKFIPHSMRVFIADADL
jgi:glycogen operon protein